MSERPGYCIEKSPAETERLLRAPHEGFRLDLFTLLPDLASVMEEYRAVHLWSFGRVKDEHTFVALTYWNSVGCVFLTNTHEVVSKGDGWWSVRSHVTDNALIRLDAVEALRYLWVHGYGAAIDWRIWVAHDDVNRSTAVAARDFAHPYLSGIDKRRVAAWAGERAQEARLMST